MIKIVIILIKKIFRKPKSKKNFWEEINGWNIDYIFKLNKLTLKFNFVNNPKKFHRLFIIDKKFLNYLLFYFDKLNVIEKQFLFSDFDCFLIEESVFNNNLNKILISLIINNNSSIYLSNKKNNNIKYYDLYKIFNLSIKEKTLSNKNMIRKQISTYLINLERRSKKPKFIFNNFINTYEMLKTNKNIVRIGDGEISLLNNLNQEYQKFDSDLKNDLEKALEYFIERDLIALNKKIFNHSNVINDRNNWQDINIEVDESIVDHAKNIYDANFWGITPYTLFSKNWEYLDKPTSFFINNKIYSIYHKEFYHETDVGKKSLSEYNIFFKKFYSSVLKNKNIIFISSIGNKKFINEDFFNDVKNISFIEVPAINSYSVKNDILSKMMNLIHAKRENNIVLISAGPLGKILCHYLDQKSIFFIDIGNFVNYYYYYNDNLSIDNIQDIHNSKKMISLNSNICKEDND